MTKLSERRVSFFKAPISNVDPCKELTLEEVYDLVKGEKYAPITEELRGTNDAESRKKFKEKNFDYVTFAGRFSARYNTRLIEHSELICIDFDHLGGDRFDLLQQLINDPFLKPVMAFTSPSGDGLKCVIPICLKNESDHQTWFRAIRNYLYCTYQVQADLRCGHVSNACFLPHDSDAYFDPKFGELEDIDIENWLRFFDIRGWAEVENFATQEKNQAATCPNVAFSGNSDQDLIERVERVADELIKRGIDITIGYDNWLKLAFSLANGLGEAGRSIFHRLSAGYPEYNYRACDAQYTACLRSRGWGITIASFFWLAQQAGVELSGLTSAKTATPPPYPNRENKPKNDIFDAKTPLGQTGGVAEVAEFSSADRVPNTFSQFLSWEKLPAFYAPIQELYSDNVSRDKLILCITNLVSGALPDTYYGRYDRRLVYASLFLIIFGQSGTSKGDLAVCRNLLKPLKKEMEIAFEQEMYEYERALAAWEAANKESRGPAPKQPVLCQPFIPANTTSSAFYRALHENHGMGIVFEEEADTLTTMLSNKEYGDYSDLLRKAHHHETVSMQRVADHLRIEIEKPRLSVCLTCNGAQLPYLLPVSNISNGLASRFLYYELRHDILKFRDVFAQTGKPIEEIFTEMGEQLLILIHALQKRKSRPIQFLLSSSQERLFLETFEELLQEQFEMLGSGMNSFVRRIALETFRMAMVFTILRRLSETMARFPGDVENHLFEEDEQALVCSDEDFESVLTIINCLVSHTARVYSVIGAKNDDPFRYAVKPPSPDALRFYAALPNNKTFTKQEALELGLKLHISDRSVERYLTQFTTIYQVVSRIKQKVYIKPTKAATSAC